MERYRLMDFQTRKNPIEKWWYRERISCSQYWSPKEKLQCSCCSKWKFCHEQLPNNWKLCNEFLPLGTSSAQFSRSTSLTLKRNCKSASTSTGNKPGSRILSRAKTRLKKWNNTSETTTNSSVTLTSTLRVSNPSVDCLVSAAKLSYWLWVRAQT